MNKSELIEKLSQAEGITLQEAWIVVETTLQGMTRTLENGDRIEIRGFGSFSVREYEGYSGRNPKTGKVIDVEAKRLPFFKASKELRQRVDNGNGEK